MLKFRLPKNDKDYYWTSHSKSKILQYRLSEQKVKAILNNPERTESGVAPNTLAVMVRNDKPTCQFRRRGKKEEIWVMYQIMKIPAWPAGRQNPCLPVYPPLEGRQAKSSPAPRLAGLRRAGKFQNKKKIIISVWRYPGVSKKRDIPIPEDVLKELEEYKKHDFLS